MAQPNKVFFLKIKKDREKKQKLWVTQRRFACYVCCEALGSIKHLKIHEEHFKEPKHSFTVGKKKMGSF